jgi:Sigma-54 interaction domain
VTVQEGLKLLAGGHCTSSDSGEGKPPGGGNAATGSPLGSAGRDGDSNLEPTVAAAGIGAGSGDDSLVSVPATCAAGTEQERNKLLAIKRAIDPQGKYIGTSWAILRVFKLIAMFNQSSQEPVLIQGPSGAGKTEIADLIHQHSERKQSLYYRYQASSTHPSDFALVHTQWVGYGPGALVSGALKKGAPGLLQEFAGGTIFIDEVAGLSDRFQMFLLDVLDRKEIRPTSGNGVAVKPDVRLIFATNVDLAKAEHEGKLRPDLCRRIESRVIHIPPPEGAKGGYCGDRRSQVREQKAHTRVPPMPPEVRLAGPRARAD